MTLHPRPVDSAAVPRLWKSLLLSVICLTAFAGPALAADPVPPPVTPAEALVPAGVKLAGVDVGGMTNAQAIAAVEPLFATKIALRIGTRSFTIAPGSLGQDARVAAAMARVFSAPAGKDVAVYVGHDKARLAALVEHLLGKTTKPAVDARWIMGGSRPRVQPAVVGRAVSEKDLRFAIIRALQRPLERSVKVSAHGGRPGREERRPAARGPDRARRAPPDAVRRRQVRQGQGRAHASGWPSAVVYPTPAGAFQIIVMQRNPWWYPPTRPGPRA